MIEKIIKTVCAEIGVHEDHIKGKSHRKEIVAARFITCYIAKRYSNMSYQTIGNHLGGRDHTTIMYAVQSIEDVLNSQHANPNLAKAYKKCYQLCQPFLSDCKTPKKISLQINK
jgi:chromosomal replication initiator protein